MASHLIVRYHRGGPAWAKGGGRARRRHCQPCPSKPTTFHVQSIFCSVPTAAVASPGENVSLASISRPSAASDYISSVPIADNLENLPNHHSQTLRAWVTTHAPCGPCSGSAIYQRGAPLRGGAGSRSWSIRRWMNHEKYPAYLAWISGLHQSNPVIVPRQLGRPQWQVISYGSSSVIA